jgi:hypothetical protein
MSKKEEKELLETFQGLIPENKKNLLAYSNVALAAQENTKKSMSGCPAAEKTGKKNRKTA